MPESGSKSSFRVLAVRLSWAHDRNTRGTDTIAPCFDCLDVCAPIFDRLRGLREVADFFYGGKESPRNEMAGDERWEMTYSLMALLASVRCFGQLLCSCTVEFL